MHVHVYHPSISWRVSSIFLECNACKIKWTQLLEWQRFSFLKEFDIQPVYKGHWRKPDNMPFLSCCPLCTCSNYMHYSLNGEKLWKSLYTLKNPFLTDVKVVRQKG